MDVTAQHDVGLPAPDPTSQIRIGNYREPVEHSRVPAGGRVVDPHPSLRKVDGRLGQLGLDECLRPWAVPPGTDREADAAGVDALSVHVQRRRRGLGEPAGPLLAIATRAVEVMVAREASTVADSDIRSRYW